MIDIGYWEARATIAEEKVKDWSVRACEAEQRIAKAREILEVAVKSLNLKRIKYALDALDGK